MNVKTLRDFTALENEDQELGSNENNRDTKRRRWNIPSFTLTPSKNLSGAYLLSVSYHGIKGRALLKLYEPKTKKIHFWVDNTGHLPYCLSNLTIEELKAMPELTSHPGFVNFVPIKKHDLLTDTDTEMTKIEAKDPLSIGGKRGRSIRDILPKAWEARIRYHNCYIYDRQLHVGMPYTIERGTLTRGACASSQDVAKVMTFFKSEAPELREYLHHWIDLFQCPIPSIFRIAIDIEVSSSVESRFPNPQEASEPIIAVSMVDSDGLKRVLLLERRGLKQSKKTISTNVNVEYYASEEAIIEEVFTVLSTYPLVLTFNGDDFDLRYLSHRAEKLGVPREKNPIVLGSNFALLKQGIHLDLYKFFYNKSIQNYAFGQSYSATTLDSIAKAILGFGKVELSAPIAQSSYSELAEYCLRDAELTLQLTSFDHDLVIKLIQILMRITKLSMENLTRQGVSSWIRNLLSYEHRRLNYLIPQPEDILTLKGKAVSTALIKGKKFKGAIVVKPMPGIHFNVSVLDFASLYPSIIKVHNLSYETVLCPHSTCQKNQIPDMPHWVCTERQGLSSLIIGSLRGVRVNFYKKQSKAMDLPEHVRTLYNVIQLTLKVLLNASYGVMGAETFTFYCPPLAETVTAIGRYVINKTVAKAAALGIEVIYGDTDSIFLKSPTQQQVTDLLTWSEKELLMELEIEKVYRYTVFSHLKKNYLGVYPDGNVDIKGLTGKKRHIPEFLKAAFMDMIVVLGSVQRPRDFENAKNRIKEIVRTCYTRLKTKKYSLDDLALKIMIGKPLRSYVKTTPQHVKAANLLVAAGHEIVSGDVISFVKTTDDLGVKPVQLASLTEVDVNKYIEYLESTFEQVLDALGLDFQEIMGVSKLESFLWNTKDNR